jgi:hypothetical protein
VLFENWAVVGVDYGPEMDGSPALLAIRGSSNAAPEARSSSRSDQSQ